MRLIKKVIIIFLVFFSYYSFGNAKGDLEGFLSALEKAKNSGFTIDAESTAKEYGYSNFEEFFNQYKKELDIGDVSLDEAKEFFLGVDRTIKIDESQKNLDKLHSLIVNDKYFRKRTGYFKKKYKEKTKLLVVYMNYEKEMAKISKNPNLDKISKFDFRFRVFRDKGNFGIESLKKGAFIDCEKSRKKYKLSGGECILVEKRYKDEFTNLLKPRLNNSNNKFVSAEKKRKAQLEKEKKQIAEEKRKIAEEKKKIVAERKKAEEERKRVAAEEKKQKEAEEQLYVIGTGSGFFINNDGYLITNDHVTSICKNIISIKNGNEIFFKDIANDKTNDISLLKADSSDNFLNISLTGPELGDDIVAFGYPLTGSLSDSVKLTKGIISSLSGPNNNYSEIQIDAAIQPGNSGGPVLNMDGQVVGIASAGLSKLYMLENEQYIPENVNFAVASSTLVSFLKANGIKINYSKNRISNTKELAKLGEPSTLQLLCLNTEAAYKELIAKEKHSDVLLKSLVKFK